MPANALFTLSACVCVFSYIYVCVCGSVSRPLATFCFFLHLEKGSHYIKKCLLMQENTECVQGSVKVPSCTCPRGLTATGVNYSPFRLQFILNRRVSVTKWMVTRQPQVVSEDQEGFFLFFFKFHIPEMNYMLCQIAKLPAARNNKAIQTVIRSQGSFGNVHI